MSRERTRMPDTPEARLQQLGIALPKQLPVLATYRLAKRHRDIIYVALYAARGDRLTRSGGTDPQGVRDGQHRARI